MDARYSSGKNLSNISTIHLHQFCNQENPEGLVDLIHKLHGSCGYSGVPRMKNLCQLIEQQLRSGTKEEDLEPELLELLDEMDNVAREASKILG